jgi:hypothetical protein
MAPEAHMVYPNDRFNRAEVRRRDEVLRDTSSHDYESSSRPKRKRKLIRSLAKFIAGTSEKKVG